MAQFLYFLPGASGLDLGKSNLCAGYGLEEMAGGGKPGERRNARGPEAQEGILVRAAAEERPLEYAPDRQTWANAGKYWIGMWNDAKPGPEDLARARLQEGSLVRLSDGNRWQVPNAKVLPTYQAIQQDGTYKDTVHAGHRQLSEMGELVYKNTTVDAEKDAAWTDGAAISAAKAQEICEAALGANYRVGPWELRLLELPDSDDRTWILWAVGDIFSLILQHKPEEDKKKDASVSG